MKKILLLPVILLLLLWGCSNNRMQVREAYMLDTIVTVKLYDGSDKRVLDGVMAVCRDYEEMFSKTIKDSSVYKLNHAGGQPLEMPEEVVAVLQKAIAYSVVSGGKYDVTVAPALELWRFGDEAPVPPDTTKLAAATARIGYQNIEINGNTVTLHRGAEIDLGSIAKGYIADKMAEYLRSQGVGSGLISLGGNIMVIGEKPSGMPFIVGVQKPFGGAGELLGTIEAKDMSYVSSGVYERYFTHEGTLYHHILDPVTGMPVQNGLDAVTVITKDSMDADALSTVLFVLGVDEGMELTEELAGVEAIFVESGGKLRFSSGFGKTVEFNPS